jgi:hypothetical protein
LTPIDCLCSSNFAGGSLDVTIRIDYNWAFAAKF